MNRAICFFTHPLTLSSCGPEGTWSTVTVQPCIPHSATCFSHMVKGDNRQSSVRILYANQTTFDKLNAKNGRSTATTSHEGKPVFFSTSCLPQVWLELFYWATYLDMGRMPLWLPNNDPSGPTMPRQCCGMLCQIFSLTPLCQIQSPTMVFVRSLRWNHECAHSKYTPIILCHSNVRSDCDEAPPPMGQVTDAQCQ